MGRSDGGAKILMGVERENLEVGSRERSKNGDAG